MGKDVLVTSENLDSLVYESRPGIKYELMPGCIRELLPPLRGIDLKYTQLLREENLASADVEDPTYWGNTRLEAALIVTKGDDLPDDIDELDIRLVSRVCEDFLRYRFLTLGRPKN